MQLFNVFTKKIIHTGTEEKILWFKAGTVKQTENGGTFLTLFHIPDQDFYIYPHKEREVPDIQLAETDNSESAYATQ